MFISSQKKLSPRSHFHFQILDQYEKFQEYDKNGDGSLDLTEVSECNADP